MATEPGHEGEPVGAPFHQSAELRFFDHLATLEDGLALYRMVKRYIGCGNRSRYYSLMECKAISRFSEVRRQ